MKVREFLSATLMIATMLFAAVPVAQTQPNSQTTTPQPADEAQIARLGGLAKVWGAVKYFHPFLAYQNIDWDQALIETIPKVKSAQTPNEYQAAVNQMLSLLGDPGTRVEIETGIAAGPPKQTTAAAKEPVLTENGVLLIESARITIILYQNGLGAYDSLIGRIKETLPAAKAVVIDGRWKEQTDPFTLYIFGRLLRQILPPVLNANVTLGSTRYRMHNGYASQVDVEFDECYSAFVDVAPEIITGQNKTKTPPIVFIINHNTPPVTDVLSGLQSTNRTVVIQEGEQPFDTDNNAFTIELPDKVKVRIRTRELVNPDGSIGFQADKIVLKSVNGDDAMREALRLAQQKNNGRPRKSNNEVPPLLNLKEKTYPEMEFPGPEYRLLALFRFWAVIDYFFPYKDLIGDSWESVLARYIPKFETNKDALDYQLTVREMVAEIHDSHGRVENANASDEKLGTFVPPILVRYIESQAVITNLLDDKLPVKIGDVILTIDGEPVGKKREYLSRFIAASTPQSLMRSVHLLLLGGQKNSTVNLRLRGVDGKVREINLVRSMSTNEHKSFSFQCRSTPVFQVLPSGYGYVDIARLAFGEVDTMFKTIKNTPAVIFDIRGYPKGTGWAIASRLAKKEMQVNALFSRPLLEAPGLGDPELPEFATRAFVQKLFRRDGAIYQGKAVGLINEDAISQAEHVCLFLEAATDVTFIGTPTMGANGNVTYTVLPGNLPVRFTGLNVRHADGRQLQRVGIQPNILVSPTIKGVAAGKDEILEAAVKFLDKTRQKKSASE
jgi:C-terminal processing protease CtpA/Prc